MWIGQNLWTGWARLALLTIKNDVARGTNFVNRHTFRKMLYKVIRFFKNLGNTAAEQALICLSDVRWFIPHYHPSAGLWAGYEMCIIWHCKLHLITPMKYSLGRYVTHMSCPLHQISSALQVQQTHPKPTCDLFIFWNWQLFEAIALFPSTLIVNSHLYMTASHSTPPPSKTIQVHHIPEIPMKTPIVQRNM